MPTDQRPIERERQQFDWAFLRQVLIVVAVAAAAYVIWRLSGVLLLIFAATLLAIALSGIADLVSRYLPIPERWSVAMSTAFLSVVLLAFLVLFSAQLVVRVNQVFDRLPDALNSLGNMLDIPDASDRLKAAIASDSTGNVVTRALGISYSVLGALGDLAVVLVSAVFLAADPSLYRRGVMKLFPANQHTRIISAMRAVGTALRQWFAGQLFSMLLVGTLSILAFWLIGIPSWFALGLIAGLTNFVPLLGPVLGAIPAVLLALTVSPVAALWTAAAVLAIQQLEGNVIMPLVQRQTVSMPPAASLFALVIFGVMFGWLGILLAVPLAVATMVLIEKLWIEDTLEEKPQ